MFDGIIIGAAAFLIIGLFHPLVIKGEYYFGVGLWPLFLVVGLLACGLSLFFSSSTLVSAILAVFGFSSFWSIKELFEQKERVAKGWFPSNPQRTSSS